MKPASTFSSYPEKKQTLLVAVFLVVLYAVFSMCDNLKGIFIPIYKEEFLLSDTQAGAISTSAMLALAIFQYLSSLIVGRLGYKRLLVISFIVVGGAIILVVFSTSYLTLLSSIFLLYIGMSMFNLNINLLGPALALTSPAILMSCIHGSYGLANSAMQRAAGTLLENGISWRWFFLFLLIPFGIMLIWAIFLKIPYQPQVVKSSSGKKALFKNPMIYLYMLAAGFYSASEAGVGCWFVNYMSESFYMGAEERALYASLFFLLKTIGLVFGGFVIRYLGYFRTVLFYAVAAAALTSAGIVFGKSGLLLIVLAGLAFSSIYPTTLSTIPSSFGKETSQATGLIMMSSSLTAMLSTLLIGLLNDFIGTRPAFFIVPLCLAFVAITSRFIQKSSQKTQNSDR